MTCASSAIRELRYVSGTTFNAASDLAAADHADWNPGTAVKLRITAFDDSGLEYESVDDATMQTSILGKPAPIPTIRRGSFSFSTYLGAGAADTSANAVATLMSKIMGNATAPTTKTYSASGTHDTTTIQATDIDDIGVGGLVLVGTRGDGGGNGECRVVTASVGASNEITVFPALPAAPSDADVIVVAYRAYLDTATAHQYIDFTTIGGSDADQRQMAGCQATAVELAGTGPNEAPMLNFSMGVGDWREVASGDRDTLSTTSTPEGNDPPTDKGLGGVFFGDAASSTRNAYAIGPVSIPHLGHSHAEIPSQNGVNGIGGWCRVPRDEGFTATFSILWDDDMSGLYDDFVNGTAKYIHAQFGHAAQKCASLLMRRCFLVAAPKRVDINGLAGVEITVRADWTSGGSSAHERAPIVLGLY